MAVAKNFADHLMPGLAILAAFAIGYDAFAQKQGWESISCAVRRVGKFSRADLEATRRDLTGFRRAVVAGVLCGLVTHLVLDGEW